MIKNNNIQKKQIKFILKKCIEILIIKQIKISKKLLIYFFLIFIYFYIINILINYFVN